MRRRMARPAAGPWRRQVVGGLAVVRRDRWPGRDRPRSSAGSARCEAEARPWPSTPAPIDGERALRLPQADLRDRPAARRLGRQHPPAADGRQALQGKPGATVREQPFTGTDPLDRPARSTWST